MASSSKSSSNASATTTITAPSPAASSTATAMSSTTIPTNRPQRSYNTRSSTVSVTQLLSDSCSSFLNRIASRVRGPSVNLESAAARSRRSKGPNSGGSARDKNTSSSHTAAAATTAGSTAAGTYTPRHSISHNDLSSRQTAAHSRHTDSRKLDHSYWSRSSREDVRDGKRSWLVVPESKSSNSAVNSSSSRTAPDTVKHHRDPLDWKYRSFAASSSGPDYYGRTNSNSSRSIYGDGDLCSSASVSDMRSGCGKTSNPAHYLGTTRSRLEDKYYDKLYSNSNASSSSYVAYKQRPLTKSATSVILSEKAYPYVSTAASAHNAAVARRGKTRDTTTATTTTTPYRETVDKSGPRSEHRHKSSSRRETVLYTFKPLRGEDRNQSRHRLQNSSSCKDFSRLRADSPHVSSVHRSPAAASHTSKSEKRSVDKTSTFKPVTPSIPTIAVDCDGSSTITGDTVAITTPAAAVKSKTAKTLAPENGKTLQTERVSSSETSDREIKRKEIQALIEKYAGLDEQTTSQELPSALVKCQKKYSAVLSNTTGPAGLVDIHLSSVTVAAAKAVSVQLCCH